MIEPFKPSSTPCIGSVSTIAGGRVCGVGVGSAGVAVGAGIVVGVGVARRNIAGAEQAMLMKISASGNKIRLRQSLNCK